MKQTIIFASILAITMGFVSVTLAQTNTPVINKRERNQERRIRQGERSGELTPKEANKLQTEQNQIRQQKRADKATGNVTPAERKTLRKEENQTSRQIYNKKHNNRTR
jgi:lipopolysaccharide export LptBFGC system permease protein LptF